MAYKNKEDQARYAKKHYEANKAAYKARAVEHKRKIVLKIKAFVLEYKLQHPCIDCGEPDPVVLDFDHRNPKEKKFSIGQASERSKSLRSVEEEINKCDVRCSNCHRRKTAKQRQYKGP